MSNEEQIKKLLAQTEPKLTHQEIADIVGVTRARVTQVNYANAARRQMNVLSPHEWNHLIDRHLFDNESITKLANEFKVSRTAIYLKLKQYEEKKADKSKAH